MTTCTSLPGGSKIKCYPPVDMTQPFSTLSARDITIYFHAANTVGKQTCKAHCEHCYFFNVEPYEVPREEAMVIVRDLHTQGYDISYLLADSYADDALLADEGGSAFRVKDLGLSAWSAGRILTQLGWEARLDRGWELGYRSVLITAHDAAGTPIVFKGVTPGSIVTQAVRNIQDWRERNGFNFQVILTFTFHKANLSIRNLRQMAQFCIDNGVDVCRFNALANFRRDPALAQYELSRDEVVHFYSCLAQLCQEYSNRSLNFALSEDIGDAGMEQVLPWLGSEWQIPNRTQWCRAGYRLFALIKVKNELRMVGCVDRWDPPLGRVAKVNGHYHIEWDVAKIEELRQAVLTKQVYACWGGVGCDGEARGFQVNPAAQALVLTK